MVHIGLQMRSIDAHPSSHNQGLRPNPARILQETCWANDNLHYFVGSDPTPLSMGYAV